MRLRIRFNRSILTTYKVQASVEARSSPKMEDERENTKKTSRDSAKERNSHSRIINQHIQLFLLPDKLQRSLLRLFRIAQIQVQPHDLAIPRPQPFLLQSLDRGIGFLLAPRTQVHFCPVPSEVLDGRVADACTVVFRNSVHYFLTRESSRGKAQGGRDVNVNWRSSTLDHGYLLSTRHDDDLPRKVRNVFLGIETLRKETTHLYIVLTKEASRK